MTRRSSSPRRTLSMSAAHSIRSSRESGKSRPFGVPSIAWPGAADPLQKGRDRARRAELADEVDVADVDAEFERGGGDHRFQVAALQPLLGREAPLLGHAAVMGGDRVLAEPVGKLARDSLAHAASVDEDEGRPVLADERGEPLVDLAPDFVGHHRFERRVRRLDRRDRAGADGRNRRSQPQPPDRPSRWRRSGGSPPRGSGSGWPRVRCAEDGRRRGRTGVRAKARDARRACSARPHGSRRGSPFSSSPASGVRTRSRAARRATRAS